MLLPRIKTSILKPATFPKDYIDLIHETFQESFKSYLEPHEQISIEGAIYPKEMLISIALTGTVKYTTCLASMELNTKKYTLDNHVHIMIDSMGSFFDEYFESEREVTLPEVWTKYEAGEDYVYMRMSTQNEILEAKADAILKT
ncbi:MAG: hypothetical protein A2Z91_01795 [Deltaproteobacteria bacterium GWA2_38_16]|nr:MAG: hypothetical protein A2Z91_01795 [Deltaproteobacteria bacterium GWA2_38_16]OGQ03034.1 MAG: hypothetical protein A3D19_01315 [Deltaproteobacteria bacterium RIFCSPHIGHO2_02_FULL_38_15]OGQ61850.1 MAG: hypothetical protein A3G92_01035 [Deltaproteobacteria bacterium RIFCSPLOWO2_12_FULL_38_8]HBQ21862.1 hypothetical protein [Deltaproteobacteria bacterium]